MLEVKKELLDSFDGYDITIKDKDSSLIMNRINHYAISWQIKSPKNYILISIKDYDFYDLFEELFLNILNCNINNFKEFSYNDYIKFINLYKNICNRNSNSLVINDKDNKLIIENHKYYFKILFLNDNTIKLSKDNLSFMYDYFLILLNHLEQIDTNNHQYTINEYLTNNHIKQKVRKMII